MTISQAPQIRESHLSSEDIQRELVAIHNADLRHFASQMPVKVYTPSLEEINEATPPALARLLEPDFFIEQAQDALGIVVIVEYGGKGEQAVRASWSVATSKEWAQEQLEKYSKPEYHALREAFKINYHWVFQVHPNHEWPYDDDDLIESHITFDQDGSPECWICDLTPYRVYE